MKRFNILAASLCSLMLLASCSGKPADQDSNKKDEGNKNQVENSMAQSDATAVIDNIMTRASVRDFTDEPIPQQTLESIVKAGMAAPSAMNKQPWAFVVVTDKAQLEALRNAHPYSNLKTATAAIIVCGDMAKTIPGEGEEYWVQDCSAATENILLAAHAYGIGAVWCGVYPVKERIADVSKVLGLPSDIVPLNIVTMGYPAEKVSPKDKWNPDAVHYQKW